MRLNPIESADMALAVCFGAKQAGFTTALSAEAEDNSPNYWTIHTLRDGVWRVKIFGGG